MCTYLPRNFLLRILYQRIRISVFVLPTTRIEDRIGIPIFFKRNTHTLRINNSIQFSFWCLCISIFIYVYLDCAFFENKQTNGTIFSRFRFLKELKKKEKKKQSLVGCRKEVYGGSIELLMNILKLTNIH